MSKALIISRKRKAKLFNKKLRKPCPETKSRFKEYNAVYTLSGAVEISEGFNNFFANIGHGLAKNY